VILPMWPASLATHYHQPFNIQIALGNDIRGV